MSRMRQLGTLLWKNFVIKRRSPLILVLETIIPIMLFVMLALVRYYEPVQPIETAFDIGRALPSSGLIPLAQSIVCTNLKHDGDGLPVLSENSTYHKWLLDIEKLYGMVNVREAEKGGGGSLKPQSPKPKNASDYELFQWYLENEYFWEILTLTSGIVDIFPVDNTCDDSNAEEYEKIALAGMKSFFDAICDNRDSTLDGQNSELNNTSNFNIYNTNEFNAIVMFWSKFLNGQLKILYTPGQSPAVKKVIQSANHTFQFLDTITKYAKQWQTSPTRRVFRHYLNTTKTSKESEEMQQKLDTIDLTTCWWLKLMSKANLSLFIPFDEEYEAVNYAVNQADADNITVFAVIAFNVSETATVMPNHTAYKIRMNATFLPSVRKLRPLYWSPMPRNWDYLYYTSGFMFIQDLIDRAIIDSLVGYQVVEPGTFSRINPMPCYLYDIFLFTNSMILPLCMTISYVYAAAIFVQNVVSEKENGLKEFMKVMGLSNGIYGLAWFITSFIQMTLSVTVVTLILVASDVMAHSDPLIIWLILEIYAIATITFCFLISSLFSNAKIASATAGMVYFLSYVPSLCIGLQEDFMGVPVDSSLKILACFLSTSAFGLCCKYIGLRESEGMGVQWSNIATSPIEQDSFTLIYAVGILIIDIFLYAFLAWYIDNTLPGAYGIPKPWYFPCTKAYWTGEPEDDYYDSNIFRNCYMKMKQCFSNDKSQRTPIMIDENGVEMQMSDTGGSRNIEKEPEDLMLSVEVNNLTKYYSNGKKAVNKLSLRMYESQVMGLLGHNGAGKSTTMSMLTGILPPTAGSIRIYGLDLKGNLDNIRNYIGYCPQHNILFDNLTAEEHLEFFNGIKRVSTRNYSQEDAHKMLDDVGLSQKKTTVVAHLSGGMKRKLSIALAFLGGSRLVILDEPTAGIDPYSRRAIWDLIMKYKLGRTILMSTHHMDEADALSDRIAVISGGTMKCCGSSIFLRNTFCDGYHLICVKGQSLVVEKVIDFVRRLLESAYLQYESNTELHFIIPYKEEKQGKCVPFFRELQDASESLGILSFGVCDSTLEEAFLRITEFGGQEQRASFSKGSPVFSPPHDSTRARYSSVGGGSLKKEVGAMSVTFTPSAMKAAQDVKTPAILKQIRHFNALIVKRFMYLVRSWKTLLSQIVLPAVFIAIAMSMSLSATMFGDPDPFVLSPIQYNVISQPAGIFSPTSNYAMREDYHGTSVVGIDGWVDSGPTNVSASFRYVSGLSATCVLDSPEFEYSPNMGGFTNINMEKYFNPQCSDYFTSGIPMSSFLPLAAESMKDEYSDMLHAPLFYPKCHCAPDTSGFVCPQTHVRPPQYKLITGDHLIDIGMQNLTEYLLNTVDQFRLHRYGGVQLGLEMPYVPELFGNGSEADLRQLTVRRVAVVYFDNRGYHSQPIYLNVINNAILRANVQKRAQLGNPAAFGITTYNHPINGTDRISYQDVAIQGTDMLIAVFIIIAMSFVPASFVVFLVYERALLVKHIQLISGLHPLTYWIANFVWDLLNYIIPAGCCIVILLAFNVPAYVDGDNFGAVAGLFFLYGWSMTPLMYPLSFVLTDHNKAYVVLIVLNLFIGTTCVITTCMLDMFSQTPVLNSANAILKKVFLPFPSYCLGRGIMDVALNYYANEFYILSANYDKIQSPLSWDVVLEKYFAMGLEGILFFLLTVALEMLSSFSIRSPCRKKQTSLMPDMLGENTPTPDEDDDVVAERNRVLMGAAADDLLLLDRLTKEYSPISGNILAVDRLTLGMQRGECFGLLGLNGAGKSTTFNMLAGIHNATAGEARLDKEMLCGNARPPVKVMLNIGYCPQTDPLLGELTGREHLQLYTRIRNIPPSMEKNYVNSFIERMGLETYADKPTRTYSGGMKRKLSAALALIGDPKVILLDEPTTGMDPGSRRFLWNFILQLSQEKRLVVLTSHSMEECEALCTRLGIMVAGKMKCLGSTQTLKNKYGKGYSITLRLPPPPPSHSSNSPPPFRMSAFKRVLSLHGFSSSSLVFIAQRHHIIELSLLQPRPNLSKLFEALGELRKRFVIADFSISQNSLESVFLQLTNTSASLATLSTMTSLASTEDEDPDFIESDKLQPTKVADF